jgi:hypothetical protein
VRIVDTSFAGNRSVRDCHAHTKHIGASELEQLRMGAFNISLDSGAAFDTTALVQTD